MGRVADLFAEARSLRHSRRGQAPAPVMAQHPADRSCARSDEPPRLVLRFAVLTAVGLAVAAGAILLLVRHFNTSQAERAATLQARFIAHSRLRDELRPLDFERPVSRARRSELDRLFKRHVLIDGVVLVRLFDRNDLVTYSNDHALIGRRAPHLARLSEVRRGTIRSDVSSTADEGARGPDLKVLRTYVPVPFRPPNEAGVVVLYQDYRPIARAADAAFFPVAGIFEAVLLLLYLLLVPALRRVTRRVRHQMQEIEYQAFYDELTGLPNRALFRERAEQAILGAKREGNRVAVMLIDLDRFKEINDTLGHQSGDVLLRDLGARLLGVLRKDETVARLGGDEFGLLLPKISDASITQVAGRIDAALRQPFELRDLPVQVEASIGAAVYPTHGQDVDTLIQRADVAMYAAKEERSGYVLYDPEDDPNDPLRLALIGELRRAIDLEELVLYFQPKADLRSGEMRGVEALVRWQHPERGLLPPGEFVPFTERTGLIRPLSRYVLAGALRQCREWKQEGIDLHVAVNLTMPDLLDLTLPDEIAQLLATHELEPSQLELEITEGTIVADPFRVRQVLARLRDMGVRLAIDDFGTGYSSLGHLKLLPVDEIKIDKSFVLNMAQERSDATIVRSIIDLGWSLGLEVVAEGVETEDIWRELKAFGCHFAQGYYISRPVPAHELTELLRPVSARDSTRARDEGVAASATRALGAGS